MMGFEQLNVYGLANLKAKEPQHVHLFAHEEFKAQLIVVPPGADVGWHQHEAMDEVLDVLEGQGIFGVEDNIGERVLRGGPGKSLYIKAGVRHRLQNDGDTVWLVRSTCRERLSPRDWGKLLKRSIRARLKMEG